MYECGIPKEMALEHSNHTLLMDYCQRLLTILKAKLIDRHDDVDWDIVEDVIMNMYY